MKYTHTGALAIIAILVLFSAGCDLSTPDYVLRVVSPSYTSIGGGNIRITFRLYNSGSESLQDCKVKFYVDDVDGDATDTDIEYDEITGWAPGSGVDLAVGETSQVYAVDTSSGQFASGVNFYGIFEMGWDYSSH